jgi:cholestenol delta-isomerase
MALALYLIPKQSPWRHPIQLVVSLGQFYGLVLYYGIPMIDEYVQGPIAAVSRPEWIYYWGEFIGLNAPWFFIPACESLSLVISL